MKCTLTLTDERSEQLKGQVDFVDNRLDAASGTIRARAVFDEQGPLPHARPVRPRHASAAPIPIRACSCRTRRSAAIRTGASSTWSTTNNVVHLQARALGPRIDGYRVIRDGLNGDETVVVNGLVRVRPGIKVTPQMTTLPPIRERSGS